MDKIFGQKTSAPPPPERNLSCIRLCLWKDAHTGTTSTSAMRHAAGQDWWPLDCPCFSVCIDRNSWAKVYVMTIRHSRSTVCQSTIEWVWWIARSCHRSSVAFTSLDIYSRWIILPLEARHFHLQVKHQYLILLFLLEIHFSRSAWVDLFFRFFYYFILDWLRLFPSSCEISY